MFKKQVHNNKGDNVAGNKFQQNIYNSKSDIRTIVNSKIANLRDRETYNLADNNILDALKEIVIELIEQEQKKSHQIVPVSNLRLKFKNLFDDKTFDNVVRKLVQEETIILEDSQICFINKQNNYKVNI